MTTPEHQPLSSLIWKQDKLEMLDQRLLPETILMLKLYTPEEVWESIHSMCTRCSRDWNRCCIWCRARCQDI